MAVEGSEPRLLRVHWEDFPSAERGPCLALKCYRCFYRNQDEAKGEGEGEGKRQEIGKIRERVSNYSLTRLELTCVLHQDCVH